MQVERQKYRHFAGSYAVQWTMINYASDHGIDRYNFMGLVVILQMMLKMQVL